MPTYEYECQTCHERLEAVQKFSDAPLTTCPACGGDLRKVFSGVGIVFKGSGFYKNGLSRRLFVGDTSGVNHVGHVDARECTVLDTLDNHRRVVVDSSIR